MDELILFRLVDEVSIDLGWGEEFDDSKFYWNYVTPTWTIKHLIS